MVGVLSLGQKQLTFELVADQRRVSSRKVHNSSARTQENSGDLARAQSGLSEIKTNRDYAEL